jgi:hypothetical protein
MLAKVRRVACFIESTHTRINQQSSGDGFSPKYARAREARPEAEKEEFRDKYAGTRAQVCRNLLDSGILRRSFFY